MIAEYGTHWFILSWILAGVVGAALFLTVVFFISWIIEALREEGQDNDNA